MSANVWYKEVEQGLVNEILNTTKYVSDTGNIIPVTSKMVFVRNPDEDLREEIFPCITLSHLYNKFNPYRSSNSGSIVIDRDSQINKAIVQHEAVPFDLVYQIDFWAKFREDMNAMTSSWLINHFKQFNLEVTDDGGNVRSSNAFIYESLKEVNLIKNQKKLYHSIISYVIWVELDDEMSYNTDMVTKEIIHVTKGGN